MAHRDHAVFAISVAADLSPCRCRTSGSTNDTAWSSPHARPGGTRLYSQDDLDRLAHIRDLLAEGLNLAGIARVLALEGEVDRLEARVAALRRGKGRP